jgi:hypothetical protein
MKTCENLTWLKDTKLADPEAALVILVGQMNVKNKQQLLKLLMNKQKAYGQQISVTDFVHQKIGILLQK